jgi:uncharacterized protein
MTTREPAPHWPSEFIAVRDSDVTWATLGYLSAIFLGPVIPLVIFASQRNKSQFKRYHSARALNLSLTVLLYVVCCAILGAMLALDSVTFALVVTIPLVFVLWAAMLKYLIRGVTAAQRGEPYDVPRWICASLFGEDLGEDLKESDLGSQHTDHCVREQPAALSQDQSVPAHIHEAVQSLEQRRVHRGERVAVGEADLQHDPF